MRHETMCTSAVDGEYLFECFDCEFRAVIGRNGYRRLARGEPDAQHYGSVGGFHVEMVEVDPP